MSYAIAFMETLTISHFPYYTHENKQLMYSVGSLFYAIYFFVSFPIYYYIDESVQKKSDWWGVAKDALAAGMLVTILLDLWRVTYGPVVGAGGPAKGMPGMS
ncbi:unnamed protein product [Pedinophyceae sp. YPF-701]|nr:unnamed protein product [Pedinophyceae sp. YPF-701]